jgi:hypothetical protein
MAVDLQMLQNIHHLPGVINAAIREVKSLLEQRDERIKDLPQYQALQDALAVIAEARTRLKIAIETDPELNRLQEEIAEAMFNMRDLREILSHHLVAYHKETGRIQQARSGRNPLAPPGGLPRRDWPDSTGAIWAKSSRTTWWLTTKRLAGRDQGHGIPQSQD